MDLPFNLSISNKYKIQIVTSLKSGIRNIKSKPAFTLIELLVVIAIIGLLVTLATITFTSAQRKGRDAQRKADLKAFQQALEIYLYANKTYPVSNAGATNFQVVCNAGSDTSVLNWGSPFVCNNVTYMTLLPKETRQITGATCNGVPCFQYVYNSVFTGGTGYGKYEIDAKLENPNDPDINQSSCLAAFTSTGYNYCVFSP